MISLHRRFGLKWQILIPSVLAVVLCVAIVQAWTLRVSQSALEQRMSQSLDIGMTLFRSYLGTLGSGWSINGGKLQIGTTTVAGREDIVDHVAKDTKGVATIFSGDERVSTNVKNPDGSRAVGTHLADPNVRDAVLTKGLPYKGQAVVVGQRYVTIYEPIFDSAQKVIGILFVGLPVAELEEVQADIVWQGSLVALVAVAILAIGLWLLATFALRPFDRLAHSMMQVSKGELDIPIPSLERRDEVGRMAQALQTFKDNSIEQRRLEAMADVDRRALEDVRTQMDQQRADNELQKTKGLLAMVEQVEHETKGAVSTVVQLMDEMTSITQTMADTARTLSGNAETVADAANEAQSIMQSAKEATESLSTSIDKVASQVRTTHEVTAKAVQASENTGRSIEALSNVVNEITGVTKIITDIARQTHLLAINAGVEATRSGQDGRGFAVIAMEVKTLSEQTSGATNKIADLVRQVHSSTNGAVDAVTEIARTIQSVNSAAEEMSRAIGNQVDMTRQIALSVNDTTDAAAQVTARVQQIAAEASASGEQAQQVDDMCLAVAESVRELHLNLVRIVRTCSEEIDRRSFHRIPTDLQADVEVSGHRMSAPVADISPGGIRVAASIGRVGEPVNVRLSGLTSVLRGRIVHSSDTATHIQFQLSAEDREALEALMQGRSQWSRAA